MYEEGLHAFDTNYAVNSRNTKCICTMYTHNVHMYVRYIRNIYAFDRMGWTIGCWRIGEDYIADFRGSAFGHGKREGGQWKETL